MGCVWWERLSSRDTIEARRLSHQTVRRVNGCSRRMVRESISDRSATALPARTHRLFVLEQNPLEPAEAEFQQRRVVAAQPTQDLFLHRGALQKRALEDEVAELVDVVAHQEEHLLGLLGPAHVRRERALADDQVRPLGVDAVADVHPLVLAPLQDGPGAVFLKPEAVRLAHHEEELVALGVVLVGERGHPQRVIPAAGGAVFVDDAALGPHEGAGPPVGRGAFLVQEFQGDHRNVGFLEHLQLGVDREKIPRGQPQPVLQPNDIVGRKDDVDAAAALGEALHVLVAPELKAAVGAEPEGLNGSFGDLFHERSGFLVVPASRAAGSRITAVPRRDG